MPGRQGFAIGSAALVSLALFGAFVSRAGVADVNVLDPKVFVGLLVGAMLPYWFSAMTMRSVGSAALRMVEEVRRQFAAIPGLMEGRAAPDYARCVRISTDASLREMMPPGALVLLAPLLAGTFFGVRTLAGLLAGALVSGVQVRLVLLFFVLSPFHSVDQVAFPPRRSPFLLPTVAEHGTMPRSI